MTESPLPAGKGSVGLFTYRMFGAALLDASVYEGIEADRAATSQALVVVLLSSAAAGIGVAGWRGPDPAAVVAVMVVALVAWVAWAFLVFQIGGRLLPERQTRSSPGELMRTIGFAASPGLLQLAGVLPRVTTGVYVVSWLWIFAATVVAVRHALDYSSNARALAVCALAALLVVVVAVVIGLMFGPALS